jgi:hypothetical protein
VLDQMHRQPRWAASLNTALSWRAVHLAARLTVHCVTLRMASGRQLNRQRFQTSFERDASLCARQLHVFKGAGLHGQLCPPVLGVNAVCGEPAAVLH